MRRLVLAALFLAVSAIAATTNVAGVPLRGKLTQSPDKKPVLDVGHGKLVYLEGDDATVAVLNDERLRGSDFEAIGHVTSPYHFDIDPITSRALFVYKDGKRKVVTYWCDVCYIRTYSPGKCVCCQKWTDLDLRDPDEP